MNRFLILYLALGFFVVSGCDDAMVEPDPDPTLEVILVEDLPALGDGGHYTFFSLRENRVVPLSDSATTAWDLAFNQTTILVNGGVSGPGQGGALVMDVAFEDLGQAPEAGYRTDTANQYAIPIGSGQGWYVYDDVRRLIFPIAPLTVVVRCADGTFAKIKFISYYKGAPEVPTITSEFRYYTFEYVHQPDGTRAFE